MTQDEMDVVDFCNVIYDNALIELHYGNPLVAEAMLVAMRVRYQGKPQNESLAG